MDGKDVVLLAVAESDSLVTPAQLQKALFLIDRQVMLDSCSHFNFVPYHYGPFDAAIYREADRLHQDGLVLRIHSPQGWTNTIITPKGREHAQKLQEKLSNDTRQAIGEVVRKVQSMTFRELLSKIYADYPAFRENSVFQS